MDKYNTQFINGFRILLASWVAIGHFYKEIGGQALFNVPYISDIIINNSPAVDGFMTITGFLMMYHYIRKQDIESPYKVLTTLKFWIRRFFRLYPVYLIVILAAYILFNYNYNQSHINFINITEAPYNSYWGIYNNEIIPSLKTFLLHLTFLHGFVPNLNYAILPPAWSLSTEVQFYLVFPLLFLLFFLKSKMNRNTSLIVVISILITYISYIIFGYWGTSGILGVFGAPSLLIQKLSAFTIGMTLALYILQKIRFYPLLIWIILNFFIQIDILTTVTILAILLFMLSEDIKAYLPSFINRIILFFKKGLSNNIFEYGSNISYSIYWYRRLGRRDISIFGKWKRDFIWEQTQLNFIDAFRAMKIVMNIYQH